MIKKEDAFPYIAIYEHMMVRLLIVKVLRIIGNA